MSVSDPETVSAKRVRRAMQELFAVDLSSNKKIIDGLIIDRFEQLQNGTLKREYSQVDSDELFGTKVYSKSNVKDKKTVKAAKKEVKDRKPGGLQMPMDLSPELASFVGAPRMSRTQLIKFVWDYAKGNNLQKPEDKRIILCDDKMKQVFKVDEFSGFHLSKMLAPHISKPAADTVADTDTAANGDS